MKTTRLTGWRKIAAALWDAPSDPQIYGAFELDATPALELIERARTQGQHVTATHLVGRAVARALVAVPELNVRLIGDRAIARDRIDVFFITAVAKGHDLTGVKIADVDRKTVIDVSKELSERSARMKAGADPDFARAKKTMESLPRPLLRVALRVSAWVAGDHARSIPSLGIPASPFGSAMVSSVGMLGLPMGFSPLAWMYRVPLLVLVGEISEKPVAIAGRVEVRPVLPITATIDHRYVDGAQLAEALKAFKEYLANPAHRSSPSPWVWQPFLSDGCWTEARSFTSPTDLAHDAEATRTDCVTAQSPSRIVITLSAAANTCPNGALLAEVATTMVDLERPRERMVELHLARLDETRAVRPLEETVRPRFIEVPETYPFGR